MNTGATNRLYNAVYGIDGIQEEEATAYIKQGADLAPLGDETALLLHAIDNNAWNLAESLIDKGVKINQLDTSNRTPLHHAAKEGNIARLKALISLSANPDIKDDNDITPLHIAAQKGHVNIVRSLLRADANVNAQD